MWRTPLCFCCVLTIAATAFGGEVLRTDSSVVSGVLLSFDGRTLQVQRSYGTDPLISIPIQDIVRVQFQDIPDQQKGDSDPTLRPIARGELPSLWQLKLTNGDLIRGTLHSWSEDKFQIGLQLDAAVLHVPTPLIREAWRNAPDLIRKANELKISTKAEDVAYVLNDNEVIAVKGTVLGIEDGSLGFIYEAQQRKIKIERLLGVVLASQKRPPASRPADVEGGHAARLLTLGGDVISGQWKAMKVLSVSFETIWNETLELRVSGIGRLETLDGGGDVFLSDLQPGKVEQTPYFDRVIPFRVDSSLDGGPLTLNDGRQYAHGIAVHSRCVLEYELGAQFTRFKTRLGFEPIPSNSPIGRVAVRVLADGATRFENPDFRSDEKPRDLDVDVHGAKRLVLEVDFGQDQDVNDRVCWGDARLLRAEGEK